jgi:lysine 6-dehydrogenase
MKRILVLGCGMVGSAIAADLSRNFDVTAVDISESRVKELSGKYNINAKIIDIADSEKLSAQIKNCDMVVSAVPGFMGYRTLQEIISNKKDVVDISFFPEDPFTLDKAAKDNNVTAVVDCGVAPGLSNIILGYHYKKEKVNSFSCYVGGLPFEREYPYQYKAPFSPSDVIEEYTRPARLKENNRIVS